MTVYRSYVKDEPMNTYMWYVQDEQVNVYMSYLRDIQCMCPCRMLNMSQ